MSFRLLSEDAVDRLHDTVLNPGELQGRAQDKSLAGALARVENRVAYGMVEDVFDLAAAYAEAIAQGHCFNDGNKRTAYRAMLVALHLNGTAITHDTEAIGDRIIALAQRRLAGDQLAQYLRERAA